jgi:hypothetical protein
LTLPDIFFLINDSPRFLFCKKSHLACCHPYHCFCVSYFHYTVNWEKYTRRCKYFASQCSTPFSLCDARCSLLRSQNCLFQYSMFCFFFLQIIIAIIIGSVSWFLKGQLVISLSLQNNSSQIIVNVVIFSRNSCILLMPGHIQSQQVHNKTRVYNEPSFVYFETAALLS